MDQMISSTGTIFDIRRYSIHDGPGIRTTVFFKGCPLHCQWCHNPESQSREPHLFFRPQRCIRCWSCLDACPHSGISNEEDIPHTDQEVCQVCGSCVEACPSQAREIAGREMTVSQVMAEVRRDIPFYDESGGGVTFSGGEPLLQRPFLLELLKECKREDIHTALDTSGYATWESLDSLRGYVDLFLYDLKLMDDDRHLAYTGVSNRLILENLWTLASLGDAIILRIPIIPGVNDDQATLREMGEFAARLPGLKRVDLLPYHPTGVDKYQRLKMDYQLGELQTPADEEMLGFARLLSSYQLSVQIGG
jgi:pyruvate formate lyase activating enzyme